MGGVFIALTAMNDTRTPSPNIAENQLDLDGCKMTSVLEQGSQMMDVHKITERDVRRDEQTPA